MDGFSTGLVNERVAQQTAQEERVVFIKVSRHCLGPPVLDGNVLAFVQIICSFN